MSIANALGEMFRRELQSQMVPLQQAVHRMEESLEALDELRAVTYRLEPLISRLGSMAGVRAPTVLPAPRAGRGGAGRAAAVRGPGRGPRVENGARGCAVIGCERQSRSKGYCSAHYQKMRLLMKTNRLPAEWKDDARPQSVRDVQLPRGRAASKALRESAPPAQAPAAPEPEAAPEAEAPARGRGRGKAGAKRGARKQARQARQPRAKAAAKRGKRGGRK
jgi:histone H1/5